MSEGHYVYAVNTLSFSNETLSTQRGIGWAILALVDELQAIRTALSTTELAKAALGSLGEEPPDASS